MSQRSPDRNRMQTGIEEEENGVVIINCAGYPRIGHGGKERTGMIVRYRPLRLPASAVKAASKPAAARAHCRRPAHPGDTQESCNGRLPPEPHPSRQGPDLPEPGMRAAYRRCERPALPARTALTSPNDHDRALSH